MNKTFKKITIIFAFLWGIFLNVHFLQGDPAVNAMFQDLALFLSNYIKKPMWQNTRSLAGKDILYSMPIIAKKRNEVALNLFFNQTPRMSLTINDILPDGVFEDENEILDLALEDANITEDEKASLFPMVRKVSIQEMHIGALINAICLKNPFIFQLKTSAQVAERNFWLNLHDIKALLAILNLNFKDLPFGEFYKVQLGLGDTSLKLGLNTINAKNIQMNLGIEGILPTSTIFNKPKHDISIENISDISGIDDLQNSMLDFVRSIRDYLIYPKFGNNGHFGFGGYLETKADVFDQSIQIWSRIAFNVLFAANEDRLFMYTQTLTPEDVDPDDKPEEVVNDQAYSYLKQYVFPSSYNVKVSPGVILNFVLAACKKFSKFNVTLGYDLYAQQKERFEKTNNSNVLLNGLNISGAQAPSAIQHKIFFEIMKERDSYLNFGVGGDVTFASKGIGKDWTIYFKLDFLF